VPDGYSDLTSQLNAARAGDREAAERALGGIVVQRDPRIVEIVSLFATPWRDVPFAET